MKISLQIILADARSPGRGLPPQPFDRHISEELPNLDNIIQRSESQYGDSARADTIQLPRRPDRPRAARRLRHSGPGAAPFAPPLGFEVPSLGLGGPPRRGARRRPETGFWLRAPSLSVPSLPYARRPPPLPVRSGPLPALPAYPEPRPGARDPAGPRARPSPRRRPRLPCPSKAARRLPRRPAFPASLASPLPLAGSLTRRSVLPPDTRDFKRRPSGALS